MSKTPRDYVVYAMYSSDLLLVTFLYQDAADVETVRVVSPIEMDDTGFLGLCLIREEPRRFEFRRCSFMRFAFSFDFLMPVSEVDLV
jgi:predicted DNA-binding transcriptional regulator YafY